MFQVGDFIIYGSSGVCRVEKVGRIDDISGIPKDKLYYTLSPIYIKGSTVYTSVDNPKVIMRPVMTRKEAEELIAHIQEIDTLWIPDEKKREKVYQETIATCSCRELVRIIKTLYLRNRSRMAEGKKMTNSDRKYLKAAEDYLYGELALPLEMDKSQVESFLAKQCDNTENQ